MSGGVGAGGGRFAARVVAYHGCVPAPETGDDWLELTSEPLSVGRALDWVGRPSCGAVTCFVGTVRDNAEGHSEVRWIDYEAYPTQVMARFAVIAGAARREWPMLGGLVIWHRVGHIDLGEASVVVVVSTPHREEGFDACEYLIDTLKATAPIWKHETWRDGTDWSLTARPIEQPPETSPR